MRRRLSAPRRFLAVAVALAVAYFPALPAQAASVSGSSQITLNFQQTPTSGFSSGQPFPISETLSTIFRTSGVLADQVDGIYAHTFTFVASTPQTLDVSTLTDAFGGSITSVRARLVAIKVHWSTDNVPLLVGGAASNEWLGLVTATGITKVYPSSTLNDGWAIWVAPQTTGMPIGSGNKSLKMDPQGASGTVDVIIATCST